VARHEKRRTGVGKLVEEVPEVSAEHGVEPNGGLVENEHLGLMQKCSREREAGTLAAGARGGNLVSLVAEPDPVDHCIDALAPDADDAGEVREVLAYGEVVVDRRGLRHVANPLPQLLCPRGQAEDGDAAGGNDLHADDRADQRRLAAAVSVVGFGLLDLTVFNPKLLVISLAVANAVLGMALGLFLSAFARTEFQAVQFMPAFVLPQILLCGLLVPRDEMAEWLQWVSAVMPFTYAYDALSRAATDAGLGGRFWLDVVVLVGVTLAALTLGAATVRRRTA
jgi:hypothetical protein